MNTAIAPAARSADKLSVWIKNEEVRDKFSAMLTEVMPVDLFISHMMVAFQDPKIARCSDRSKYEAMHNCAALGLLPTLGQVVLIPYKDTLKAMPQWQGYKAIMERIPDVLEVIGVLVHKKDEFSYVNGLLHHEYDPLDDTREFKSIADIRGGYCIIMFTNGRPPKHHFTTAKHIDKARACAQTQDVWNKWFYQMALKTLYRDCYARRAVPIDPVVGARMKKVLDADDEALGNIPGTFAGGSKVTAADVTRQIIGEKKQQAPQPTVYEDMPEPEIIDVEPEPEQQASDHTSDTAELLAQWHDEIMQMDSINELNGVKSRIPAVFSPEERQVLINAIEMRQADIRGSRGGKGKNGTLFDDQVSATEGGM